MAVIKSKEHHVVIGNAALKSFSAFLTKNKYSSIYILCDDHTLQLCLPLLIVSCPGLKKAEIIEIENGETSKSLEITAQILQTLLENKADKNSLLVNLGGGVVSDLGGFIGSIYKRGIDFINVPTSLMAMADASVGGKTGIDFGGIKNSVGSFAQPKAVYINPEFLETLPERHVKNGLAEIYKISLVADKMLWNSLKDKGYFGRTNELLTKSVVLKNKIVLKDPFDRGARKVLNFGHTLGHALESLLLGTPVELLHGEAIVIGMIMESHLAFQKKLIQKETLSEICSVLMSVFMPQRLKNVPLKSISELMNNDKKTSGGTYKFSLISEIGNCQYEVKVIESQVEKAFKFYTELFA